MKAKRRSSARISERIEVTLQLPGDAVLRGQGVLDVRGGRRVDPDVIVDPQPFKTLTRNSMLSGAKNQNSPESAVSGIAVPTLYSPGSRASSPSRDTGPDSNTASCRRHTRSGWHGCARRHRKAIRGSRGGRLVADRLGGDLIVVRDAIRDARVVASSRGEVVGDPREARGATTLVAEDVVDPGRTTPRQIRLVVPRTRRQHRRRRRRDATCVTFHPASLVQAIGADSSPPQWLLRAEFRPPGFRYRRRSHERLGTELPVLQPFELNGIAATLH